MATTLTAENREFIPKLWEEVACPFCGGAEAHVFERFGYEHRYTYQKCSDCKLVYQTPRPVYDEDFVETAYEVYSTTLTEFWDGEKLTPRGQVVHDEYALIVREMEKFIGRKGRLLDIGSNTGFFCKTAADCGWAPVGVEISRSMVELSRKAYGIEAIVGDWMTIDFQKRFDVIYSSHVIEHIPDPAAWLKRMKEILAPGGIVCLSVPNMQSIDRKFKRTLKRLGLRKDHWAKWQTPDHLYEPCEKSMLRFFEANGYELLRNYTYPSEWGGAPSAWQRLFHFKLRWGAKARFYIRPVKNG